MGYAKYAEDDRLLWDDRQYQKNGPWATVSVFATEIPARRETRTEQKAHLSKTEAPVW